MDRHGFAPCSPACKAGDLLNDRAARDQMSGIRRASAPRIQPRTRPAFSPSQSDMKMARRPGAAPGRRVLETPLRKLATAAFLKVLRRQPRYSARPAWMLREARAPRLKRALMDEIDSAAARRHKKSAHAAAGLTPASLGRGGKKEQTPLPARDICRGSHPQDFSADVSVFRAHLPSAPPVIPARQSHWSVEKSCRLPPRAPRGRGVSGQDKIVT